MMPGTLRVLACLVAASAAVSACTARPASAPGTSGDAAPSGHPSPPSAPAAVPGPGATLAGIYHPLEKGLTLYTLAKAYGVTVDALLAANHIVDPRSIPAGTLIFIPGAREMLSVIPAPGRSGFQFAWPLEGPVTSRFGSSERRRRHAGIDIDGETGDEIRAAADGRVARVANNAQYGLLVVLAHDDGYATWYAHASALLVRKGETVRRGQVIARVGRTGNARGSHLHFEVRREGSPVDPMAFLPQRGEAGQSAARR